MSLLNEVLGGAPNPQPTIPPAQSKPFWTEIWIANSSSSSPYSGIRIQLDALRSLQPVYENDVPSFPVEDGGSIGDHISRRPIEIQLSGVVSNVSVIALDPPTTGNTRSGYVRMLLAMARANRAQIAVVSEDVYFNGLYIKSFQHEISWRTSGSLDFTLKLVNIMTTTARTVKVAPIHKVGKRKKKVVPQAQNGLWFQSTSLGLANGISISPDEDQPMVLVHGPPSVEGTLLSVRQSQIPATTVPQLDTSFPSSVGLPNDFADAGIM